MIYCVRKLFGPSLIWWNVDSWSVFHSYILIYLNQHYVLGFLDFMQTKMFARFCSLFYYTTKFTRWTQALTFSKTQLKHDIYVIFKVNYIWSTRFGFLSYKSKFSLIKWVLIENWAHRTNVFKSDPDTESDDFPGHRIMESTASEPRIDK